MLQSPIGRVASQPMRNIETFPSKHMYLYLSLVERKVAEFYHNMVKMTYFHRFLQTIDGVLVIVFAIFLSILSKLAQQPFKSPGVSRHCLSVPPELIGRLHLKERMS